MQLFGVLVPEKEQLVATAVDVVKGRAGMSLYASLFGLVIGLYAIAAIFIQNVQFGPGIEQQLLLPVFIKINLIYVAKNWFRNTYFPKNSAIVVNQVHLVFLILYKFKRFFIYLKFKRFGYKFPVQLSFDGFEPTSARLVVSVAKPQQQVMVN